MGAADERSFAKELSAISAAHEQVGRGLLLLKELHEAEKHAAVSQVTAKVKELLRHWAVPPLPPGSALPHQIVDVQQKADNAHSIDFSLDTEQSRREHCDGSAQTKLEQYLGQLEIGEKAEHLSVVPVASSAVPLAVVDRAHTHEALISGHSAVSFGIASADHTPAGVGMKAMSTQSALLNGSDSPSSANLKSRRSFKDRRVSVSGGLPDICLTGQVKEIWEGAKQESLSQLSERCKVHIVHHSASHMAVQNRSEKGERSHTRDFHAMVPDFDSSDIGVKLAYIGQGLHDLCFCIINPIGPARFIWNAMCLLFICYDLWLVPMQAFDLEDVKALQVFEWILTVWWTLDVYMTFRTGYIDGTRIEMGAWKIAMNYSRSWLLPDLCIVAVEWLCRFISMSSSASVLRTQRILRVFRFMKLFRVGKVTSFWSALQDQVNSNIINLCITLGFMVFLLLLVMHITACLWYFIGSSANDGWPTLDEYQGEKDRNFMYVAAVRWVVAQINGRTDLDERRNGLERLFTVSCGIWLALIANAVFISFITKALFDLSEVVSEKTRRQRLLNGYLEAHPLHAALTSQVKRTLRDYQDVDKEVQKEVDVLAILPHHLKIDVLEEARAPVLMQHPFFHSLPFECPYIMRMICCNVVKAVSAVKDEKVFDKGDYCERMLFTDKVCCMYGSPVDVSLSAASQITKSSVKAENTEPSVKLLSQAKQLISDGIRKVGTGSWISEAALWVEWRNQGRLVADKHGVVLAVSAKALATGLRNEHQGAYSLAYLHAKNVALELSQQDSWDVSDILPFEVQLYSPLYVDVTIVSAAGLRNADGLLTGKSDPYCVCKVSSMTGKSSEVRFKTHVVDNTLDPVWNCTRDILVSRHQFIEFHIFDHDYGKRDQELGIARLRPEDFFDGFDGDLYLQSESGEHEKGSLKVKIQVLDHEPEAPLWPKHLLFNPKRMAFNKKKTRTRDLKP